MSDTYHPHPNAGKHFQSVLAALRAATVMNAEPREGPAPAAVPFITISREAGAGGKPLASHLADALNRLDPDAEPWHAWDKDLITKVSAEHDIPEDVVAALEDTSRPWFQQFLEGLSMTGANQQVEELAVYRRVAAAVRALAGAGRAIIVGRGGVFITQGMPGGVHLRLVAPLKHRVKNMARRFDLTAHEAARRVTQLDQSRQAFYRRFWPRKKLSPEMFTLTINTADLTDQQMVECVLPAVTGASRAVLTPPRRCQCKHDTTSTALHLTGLTTGGAI